MLLYHISSNSMQTVTKRIELTSIVCSPVAMNECGSVSTTRSYRSAVKSCRFTCIHIAYHSFNSNKIIISNATMTKTTTMTDQAGLENRLTLYLFTYLKAFVHITCAALYVRTLEFQNIFVHFGCTQYNDMELLQLQRRH